MYANNTTVITRCVRIVLCRLTSACHACHFTCATRRVMHVISHVPQMTCMSFHMCQLCMSFACALVSLHSTMHVMHVISHVPHDALIRETWLIQIYMIACGTICVTKFFRLCGMSLSHVGHDSFMSTLAHAGAYVWHDSSVCVACLFHMWDGKWYPTGMGSLRLVGSLQL